MTYDVTEHEVSTGVMSADKLSAIAEDIATIGYAVVGGLIPSDVCELLMASVLEDAEQIRALGETTPHEKATGQGHLQLGLRRYAPYVRAELVANALIERLERGFGEIEIAQHVDAKQLVERIRQRLHHVESDGIGLAVVNGDERHWTVLFELY